MKKTLEGLKVAGRPVYAGLKHVRTQEEEGALHCFFSELFGGLSPLQNLLQGGGGPKWPQALGSGVYD